MNFLNIFNLITTLAKPVVLTIQAVHGTKVAGGTKSDMAQTALAGALATSGLVLSDKNTALATQIAALVSGAINTTVAITKMTGEYQAASASSLNLPAPTLPATPAA